MTSPDPDLRQHLLDLPEPPLPDGLWPRIDAARARRMRRIRGLTGTGIAVLFACAIAVPMLHAPDQGPPHRQATAPPPVPATAAFIADLQVLDHALQTAYARGASDDEVAPLWRARRELLAAAPARPVSNGI